jgi:hypothetical protein
VVEQESRLDGTFEFNAIHAALENERRLIAAGKIQRWDTVKWVVTVNVALAASAAALLKFISAPLIVLAFGGIALLVSLIGCDLLRHYNDDRLSGARRAAWLLEEHLEHEYGIDIRGIEQQSKREPARDYDPHELRSLHRAIMASAAPAVLVAAWAIYQSSPGVFSG